jgi:hypothetical protein
MSGLLFVSDPDAIMPAFDDDLDGSAQVGLTYDDDVRHIHEVAEGGAEDLHEENRSTRWQLASARLVGGECGLRDADELGGSLLGIALAYPQQTKVEANPTASGEQPVEGFAVTFRPQGVPPLRRVQQRRALLQA